MANLVALCRKHHRAHHHDQLGVTGNPDLPVGTDGALAFTTACGVPIERAGHPIAPEPSSTPAQAARAAGLPDAHYERPLGERLDWDGFWINHDLPEDPPGSGPKPEADADPGEPPDPPASNDSPWDRTPHHPPPGTTADGEGGTDPTRAGPDAA